MTQTARPASDITTTNWTTAPLFSKVNDASDATTIRNANGTTTFMEVKLGPVTDPQVGTGHIVYVRCFSTGSGAAEKGDALLYQGTTLIATGAAGTNLTRTTPTTISYTLTAGEVNSITDYTDLRVRVAMTTGGATEFMTVQDIWMEFPDAPSTPISGDDTAAADDTALADADLASTEDAAGDDASLLTAALPVTDTAIGADAASVAAGSTPVSASDAATSSDVVTAMARPVTDTATAAESVPTFAKAVIDSATSTEGIPTFARTVVEVASGADVAAVAIPTTATIAIPLPSVIQALTAATIAPVFDSFDRADGAIGTSDSGHTWLAQSGTWSISSNRAYRSTSEGQATVVVDSGMTSVALSADAVFAANPDSGVIFGGIDDNNYLLFSFSGSGTSLILWKRDASTFTLLGSYTVASYASTTQAIRVEWFANTGLIGLWFGGLLIGTVTLSAGDRTKYAPGTRQGLREHTIGGERTFFDNYSASLPTEWSTATASNMLGHLSTLTTARHANTTDWSNEASDTTEAGAGTQVIVVTAGV